MKFIFIIISTFLASFFHADGLAEYHYYMDQNHIILKFEIEQDELLHYRMIMDCKEGVLVDLCTASYIMKQSKIKIGHKNVEFELVNSTIYNGHAVFKFKSINTYKSIFNIHVENHCFLEANKSFKNRVRLELGKHNISYLLVKGKETIHLQ